MSMAGGLQGMATVQLLRELEARTGRRIPEMFDLICGTSTGGLLAVALGLRGLSLDDCERIYKVLGQKVSPPAAFVVRLGKSLWCAWACLHGVASY